MVKQPTLDYQCWQIIRRFPILPIFWEPSVWTRRWSTTSVTILSLSPTSSLRRSLGDLQLEHMEHAREASSLGGIYQLQVPVDRPRRPYCVEIQVCSAQAVCTTHHSLLLHDLQAVPQSSARIPMPVYPRRLFDIQLIQSILLATPGFLTLLVL